VLVERDRLGAVLTVERQHVERAVDPVDPCQHVGRGGVPQVRLPELDAGQDRELREVVAAAADRVEVAVDVEGRQPDRPVLVDQCTGVRS
jgi:hypothetical protein